MNTFAKAVWFSSRSYQPLLAAVGLLIGSSAQIKAQSYPFYKIVHNFGGTVSNADGQQVTDGSVPLSSVASDSEGNLYGTTFDGGNASAGLPGPGVAWELTKSGAYKILHQFGGTVVNANGKSGPDGSNPSSRVVIDSEGNLYGTTNVGGPNVMPGAFGSGMVWEITKFGLYKDLHDFGGTVVGIGGQSKSDGYHPEGSVRLDAAGNLVGTTTFGGLKDDGIIWEITKDGAYLDLHDFGGQVLNSTGQVVKDGIGPLAGVTFDVAGNMFGVAPSGGMISEHGMVWEISKAGAYTDIHDFGGSITNANGKSGNDGSGPWAPVVFDSVGNLFGTTVVGGSNSLGIVWELSKAGIYRDIHDFGGTITSPGGQSIRDGSEPFGGLVFDVAGNLFGTTSTGGRYVGPDFGGGNVWEITKSGSYKDLHDFGGNLKDASAQSVTDGEDPQAELFVDSSGELYGTTEGGGSASASNPGSPGTVFCLSNATDFSITGGNEVFYGGRQYQGTVLLAGVANNVNASVKLSSDNQDVVVPSTVTIPSNTASATFSFTAKAVSQATRVTITATLGAETRPLIITVQPAGLAGVETSSTTVVGSSTTPLDMTLTLTSPAPVGGATVTLKSSDPSVLSVPPTFTVPAGYTRDQFTITHSKVTSSTSVTITATYCSVSKTQIVTFTP